MKRSEERENALAAPEHAGSGETQFSPLSFDASAVDAQSLAHELRAALSGDVHFDDASRAMHATDASVYQILPLGVVTPRSREDVVQVVEICRRHGVSITARGGGTSQAGQAIGPGISLDFSRYMNRVLDLDIPNATVTVEPGIVLDELNAQPPAPRPAAAPGSVYGQSGHHRRDDRQQLRGHALRHLWENDRLCAIAGGRPCRRQHCVQMESARRMATLQSEAGAARPGRHGLSYSEAPRAPELEAGDQEALSPHFAPRRWL